MLGPSHATMRRFGRGKNENSWIVGPVTSRRAPVLQRHSTGHYDVRRGAAAYAPVLGAFGALAVPGIVLVFQSPLKSGDLTTLASGLLAVAVMGSLFAAIGLAAIGAESVETANLPGAIVRIAVPTVVAIVSLFAAFEVLASHYVPATKVVFMTIAATAAASGIIFNSFAVVDAWGVGPSDHAAWQDWITTQWLRSPEQALRETTRVMWCATGPFIALLLRATGLVAIPTEHASVYVILFVAVAAIVAGTMASALRTIHTDPQQGIRPTETWVSNLALASFASLLIFGLP